MDSNQSLCGKCGHLHLNQFAQLCCDNGWHRPMKENSHSLLILCNVSEDKGTYTQVFLIPNNYIDDCLRNHLLDIQGKFLHGAPLRDWDPFPFEVSVKNPLVGNITYVYQCGRYIE